MACPCPYCGTEYEDVNALMEHRSAALARAREQHRRSLQPADYSAMLGAPEGDVVLPDNAPMVPAADPGGAFLGLFGRKGGR